MVSEFVSLTKTMTPRERLTLAKLLLESVLTDTRDEEADWMALGLENFQQDWDNAADAIYDKNTLIATRLDTEDAFTGMFAQEPELVDQIVTPAMHSRETTPLRARNG